MPHVGYARDPGPLPWRNTLENANSGSATVTHQSPRKTASLMPGSAVRSIAGNTVARKKPPMPNASPGSTANITEKRCEGGGQRLVAVVHERRFA